MTPHHYFAILVFVINAAAAIAICNENPPAPTVTYPVDFKCTLDVDGIELQSYKNFINDLRTMLAGAEYSGNNVPILPNYGREPHLFDVVLTTGEQHVTVRGRRDNLYVRGFLGQTSRQWMEFQTRDEQHMVDPESKILTFGDSYPAMEKAAEARVTRIYYTKEELKKAVKDLAEPTTNVKDQAHALIIMAQMISEAARFELVSQFFGDHLFTEKYIGVWMLNDVERRWKVNSQVVQCHDAYQEMYPYTPVTINGKVYETVEQLSGIFGVMLQTKVDKNTCGIKKLADEDEGETVVVLSADM